MFTIPTLRLILLAAAMLTVSVANAETTTYRWIDKTTGQTVFSDKPPPPGVTQVVTKTGSEPADGPQLPYATRQAVERFPVMLYTTASCTDVCKQARDLLNGRGVPFSEKMLKTDDETAELAKKLGGEASVPSLFVGQQSFKGLESVAWNNLLDLAGYPKSAPYGAKPSGTFAK